MAEKRATIALTGDVQDAGFRGKVMRIAQKQELTGYIENLPDGSVRVVCEGDEDLIDDFSKKLDIHEEYMDVEKIEVEFTEPTGEFEDFRVIFSDLGMEMFQGFATAGKMLNVVGLKVDGVSSDVRAMHSDMNNRFDKLDHTYGEFGKDMKTLKNDIGDMKLLASEFREFKDLFAVYVKHELEKDSTT